VLQEDQDVSQAVNIELHLRGCFLRSHFRLYQHSQAQAPVDFGVDMEIGLLETFQIRLVAHYQMVEIETVSYWTE
jgi:hypothetical protein